ncbi:hypothetical protein INR49_002257, partial [Caranx melampygus]
MNESRQRLVRDGSASRPADPLTATARPGPRRRRGRCHSQPAGHVGWTPGNRCMWTRTGQKFEEQGNRDSMGASSSGLLDEAKISHIKGLVDGTFQSFSELYRQQYSSAYFGHIHQEVEPKKEGRGLLLSHRPKCAPEEVLYQGNVKFSGWEEQGKKCRERYTVLRRDYTVEIHENLETFNRGSAAKLVLHPVGGSVLTTEEESRAHLEQICAGILNGVKEDSSSVVSPDEFAVYLHLPYTGHTCFLFQNEEERGHFLSALKTCIRHRNLDPWCESSYESHAYLRALWLYRRDKGCFESWEMLLGTEEQVLASQVMEEVLPWLQSQLQSRMKGKKAERIRQWLATIQATYMLVLEQLTAGLKALRETCHQTALANQALIRSNLDQILSSHSFLEEKIRGIQGMQQTLHSQMDSAFKSTNGGSVETKKALLSLRSINLDQCYKQVKNLTTMVKDLKQRFGVTSVQRLVHSAHLEMEQLLDSAVYTFELFLQSSARLEPSQIPMKMERAKERVLKQLDYDSRLVQRRLYKEALLEITLPVLTRRMDSKWKSVVVQEAASKKSNNLLLDISDLAISQYSLLGQTPPASAPDSPNIHARDSSSPAPGEEKSPAPVVVEEEGQMVTAQPQTDPEADSEAKSDPSTVHRGDPGVVLQSPLIIVTQQSDELETTKLSTDENAVCGTDTPQMTDVAAAEPSSSASPDPEAAAPRDGETPDTPAIPESTEPPIPESIESPIPESTEPPIPESIESPIPESTEPPIPDAPEPAVSTLSLPPSSDVTAEPSQSDQSATLENPATSDQTSKDACSIPPSCPSPSHPSCTDSPMKISLGMLNEAIVYDSTALPVIKPMAQQSTDRAVYLTGHIKDSWEMERAKQEKQKEAEAGEKTEGQGDHEEEGGESEVRKEDEEKVEDGEQAEEKKKKVEEGEQAEEEEEKVEEGEQAEEEKEKWKRENKPRKRRKKWKRENKQRKRKKKWERSMLKVLSQSDRSLEVLSCRWTVCPSSESLLYSFSTSSQSRSGMVRLASVPRHSRTHSSSSSARISAARRQSFIFRALFISIFSPFPTDRHQRQLH